MRARAQKGQSQQGNGAKKLAPVAGAAGNRRREPALINRISSAPHPSRSSTPKAELLFLLVVFAARKKGPR